MEERVGRAVPCAVGWHRLGLLALAQPGAEPRTMLTGGQYTWPWAASPGPLQGPLLLTSIDVTLRQILSWSCATVIPFLFGKLFTTYLNPKLLNPNTDTTLSSSSHILDGSTLWCSYSFILRTKDHHKENSHSHAVLKPYQTQVLTLVASPDFVPFIYMEFFSVKIVYKMEYWILRLLCIEISMKY